MESESVVFPEMETEAESIFEEIRKSYMKFLSG